MSSLRKLHQEGNRLFEVGELRTAADTFQSSVHAFIDAHSTAPDDVEVFVKVAGNWLVCLHQLGERSKCVATARELLSTYPIIPKAYGAIGMCIVDELLQQQAEEASRDAHTPLETSPSTSPSKHAHSSVPSTHPRPTASASADEGSSGIRLTHRHGSSGNVDEVPPTAAHSEASGALTAGTNGPAVEHADAPVTRARTAEERRQDPRRYWVRLGGVVCTVDDAHTYLCRAVSLAPQLQRSLQPHLDLAVRMISEQLLSAAPALERELRAQRRAQQTQEGHNTPADDSARLSDDIGAFVLDTTCPAESDGLLNIPVTLATAPKLALTRVQMINMDDPNGPPVSLPDSAPEAQAARQQYAEEQQQHAATDDAQGGTATAMTTGNAAGRAREDDRFLPEQRRPTDFSLSGAVVPVRVCHSERGGLPRSLTVVRAAPTPFAVGRWVQSVATTVAPDGSAARLLPGLPPVPHHVDPSTMLPLTAADGAPGLTMGVMGEHTSSGGPACCAACGKEISLMAATTCDVCGLTSYCSSMCAESYKTRHEAFECAGLVLLQREITAAAEASLEAADDKGAHRDEHKATAPSSSSLGQADLPGSAWTVPDLLHRVVPLTVAAYSGLRTHAPGWETVSAALERGVHRNLRALVPPTVARVLERLEEQLSTAVSQADAADNSTAPGCPQAGSLSALFFVCRLYQSRLTEAEASVLYAEKMLLRHSCEPNCVWSDVTRTITTGRFIVKGEELTLAVDQHFPQHWPHQVRIKWWLRHHGFVCQCARCLRESRLTNSARGDLSDDLVEQLLSADTLRKPTAAPTALSAKPTADAKLLPHHPTHFFHPLVQAAVLAGRSGRQPPEKVVAQLHELRHACAKYLLPTHYLFEDLRAAERTLAEVSGQADVTSTLGRESMLFMEALWAGATAGKVQVMESIPQVFDCRRRHIHNRRMRRQTKTRQDASAHAGGSAEAPATAAARSSLSAAEVADVDQSIVDRFMGSYRAWYL